jgi:hypothetical protein
LVTIPAADQGQAGRRGGFPLHSQRGAQRWTCPHLDVSTQTQIHPRTCQLSTSSSVAVSHGLRLTDSTWLAASHTRIITTAFH